MKWIDQVLDLALERKPEPLAASEAAPAVPPVPEEQPVTGVVTH